MKKKPGPEITDHKKSHDCFNKVFTTLIEGKLKGKKVVFEKNLQVKLKQKKTGAPFYD
ncbi:hypothetical protein ACFL5V_02775 [Fibrobacterota bacterium]